MTPTDDLRARLLEMIADWEADDLAKWMDRLSALPQQAGGEDGPVPLTEWQQLVARAEAAEAALREAERDAARGREIAAAFLPVMEAMRPLVLNLERLKDAALGGTGESE